MADAVIPVNPATAAPIINMDVEAVVGPAPAPAAGTVARERVQWAGSGLAEIARVQNTEVAGTEMGGVVRSIPQRTSTAPTITQVVANAANVQLLAANGSRKQACFTNDAASTGILLLKLGAAAATNSYTVAIRPGGYYELPQPVWTGEIDGIWTDAAAGSALITEIT